MVKIPDLTNKQLVSQLEKYGKIMGQLVSERDRRSAKNDSDELYTKAELLKKTKPTTAIESDNLLSFDEDELNAIEQQANKAPVREEDDEEVGVTQLLKLSKEDLVALQANKKKIKG